ncbi:MAG: mycothiol synthase, partial [Longispora sp.]|nr:mycothiol synthase [Longispora sp. (in: high G+C Gram-positive bacteria)]
MHSVTVTSELTTEVADKVLALCRAAGDSDGAYPLSEHVVLHIRGGSPAHHVLIQSGEGGEELEGYAHVDSSDLVDGPSAELVVHPMRRRRGHGHRLVDAAIGIAEEQDPQGRLRLWAHGDHPSASALAIRLGFARHRSLWQMRRSLYTPIEAPVLPEDVTVRAFRPGHDEEAWLAVNTRAFAEHPEQGRWSLVDLKRRMAE